MKVWIIEKEMKNFEKYEKVKPIDASFEHIPNLDELIFKIKDNQFPDLFILNFDDFESSNGDGALGVLMQRLSSEEFANFSDKAMIALTADEEGFVPFREAVLESSGPAEAILEPFTAKKFQSVYDSIVRSLMPFVWPV